MGLSIAFRKKFFKKIKNPSMSEVCLEMIFYSGKLEQFSGEQKSARKEK